jgi:hypothetical protein
MRLPESGGVGFSMDERESSMHRNMHNAYIEVASNKTTENSLLQRFGKRKKR